MPMRPLTTLFKVLPLTLVSGLLAAAEPVGVTPFEKTKAAPEASAAAKPESPRGRLEFLKDHPELKEQMEKLKAMSPEERQAWLKAHPDVAEKIEKAKAALRERGENLTPEEREKLKARFKERLDKLSPEEREAMLKKHPELKEKLGEAGK